MFTRHRYRQVVIALAACLCVFYLLYRLLFTLNLTTPFAASMSIMLFLGEFYGVFVLLLFFVQVWDSRESPLKEVLPDRTVDVFVPTYNEDPQLLRATLEACYRLDYPHRTYLCDDGGTDARMADPNKAPAARQRADILKAMCAEFGATYIARPDNRHAKAGNLNHAFEKTDGEFIVILDADHVPEPHFLSRVIGYFQDERLGFVQTPHAFYNFDSFQARLDNKKRKYWEEGHLFYEVIQPGRNRWNCPIFAGSAAMFRRQALAEVGYIATETITEDMHTGMRVNARGWKSLAISERLVAGQAAPDITTFHSQRIRWGEGNLSIMAYDNPLTMKGLTWAQRLCYLGSMVHWAGGLFKLAIYVTPILMLFTGVPPVNQFNWQLIIITLLYLFGSIYGVKTASNGYGSFLNGELFCMVNFWTQIQGTMKAIFWRKFQKFVVTTKRGRQSKSIWPFVRPQVTLIVLGGLALAWGWWRMLFGLSDDYFKPIIPSLWILFHTVLAFMVLRRALWPEDRRFSCRHIVHLPVGYQYMGVDIAGKGEPVRQVQDLKIADLLAYGVTVDLNELGMGLVSYQRLPLHALVRLTLRGAGEVVRCVGHIKSVVALARPDQDKPNLPAGTRYGIAFHELKPKETDALNRICLHYAVPRLYAEFANGNRRLWWQYVVERVGNGLAQRRRANREPFRLPLILNPEAGQEGAVYSVTENLSRTSMAALLTTEVPVNTEINFLLAGPLGDIRGRGRVTNLQTRYYAARPYQYCVLELVHFEGEGRLNLEILLNHRENRPLVSTLKPERQPLPVPMARPLGYGALAFLPVLLVAFGCFRFFYREEFFLHDLVSSGQPLTEVQIARLNRVYTETMAQRYPSTDRLVLLMGAMNRAERSGEIDFLTMRLAPRDLRNLDLQIALAHALDNTKDSEQAEAEYQHLLRDAEVGPLPAARRRELLLGAARSSVHAGNLDRASKRFGELLAAEPGDMALRNEVAGVLIGGKRLKEAAHLYDGVEPDLSGRLLLITIHTMAQEIDQAERECRQLIAKKPGEVQYERLLADVLSCKASGYTQSRAIYERLALLNANDPEVGLRLARIALWDKNYDEALQRYQALLDQGPDQPEVIRGYVDAAASAAKLGEPQHRTALALYDHLLTAPTEDAVFLARLAWVLQQVKENDKSAVLLDRAVALNPTDPTVRKQYLGALVTAGRVDEVLKQFQGKEVDPQTRRFIIGVHLKNQNFGAAEQECRQLLATAPDDPKTKRLLADILTWKKPADFSEALVLFEQLQGTPPGEPNEVSNGLRLAEVALWAGAYEKAAQYFQVLLAEKFDQPELWTEFVDASAGTRTLSPEQIQLALRIADQPAGRQSSTKPVVGARLAWVLFQGKERARAEQVLDHEVANPPELPAPRKELARVLAAAGRFNDALTLLEPLAPKDPEARANLAEVTLWSGAFEKALDHYQKALEEKLDQPELWPGFVDAGASAARVSDAQGGLALQIFQRIDPEKPPKVEFLSRLGWVLSRTGHSDQAKQLLDKVLAIGPREPQIRREVAGVLEALKRYPDVLHIYDGLPLERADTLRLVRVHTALRDFDSAEKHCRDLLLKAPGDQELQLVLANVLSSKGAYPEALALIDSLLRASPNDRNLQVRLAEVLLWSGNFDRAVDRFQELLETDFNQPDLWPYFINAAASARNEALKPAHFHLAVRLADTAADKQQKAEYWCRLAWVLLRGHEDAQAGRALDNALALKPADPVVRAELAGVLAAARRFREALPLLEELARANPKDLLLQRRLAEVTLWAGMYDVALTRFQTLLEAQFDQSDLWPGFVDAAAGAHELKENHGRLALRLSEQTGSQSNKVEYLCRLAWVLYRTGQGAPSVAMLDRAVALHPMEPEVRSELAGVLEATQRYRDVLALYEGVTPDRVDRLRLIRVHTALQEYDSAETNCRELLREKPDDKETQLLLANVLSWKGNYADALVLLEGLLHAEPGNLRLRVRLAEVLLWSRAYGDALARLQVLLEEDFNQPDLWPSFVDAAASVDEKMLTPAQAGIAVRIEQAATDKDFKPAFWIRLAWVLLRVKETDLAGKLLDKVQALKPQEPVVQAELAGVLAAAKRFTQALPLLEHLTVTYPDDQALQVRLAEVTLAAHLYSRALERFQVLLEKDFDRPALWAGFVDAAASSEEKDLGTVHAQLAVRIAQKTTAKGNGKVEFLSRLAWVLLRVGDRVQALGLLDRALALKPQEPIIRKELAGVLAAAGRPEQALELYAGLELIEADRIRLAGIHAAAHDFDSAEKEVRAFLKTKPGDLEARLLLADVLSWNKKFAPAEALYRELQKERPDDTRLPIRLAQLALWSGEYDSALARFQEILGANQDQPALWEDYINAIASAQQIGAEQRKMVLFLYEKGLGDKKDAVFLGRFAWVLRKIDEGDKGIELLEKALASEPASRDLRLQLAEALQAKEDYDAAEKHFRLLLRPPQNPARSGE